MYLNIQHCFVCHEGTEHINNKCSICDKKEYQNHIDTWNALSLDEKLNNIRERLEQLEEKRSYF